MNDVKLKPCLCGNTVEVKYIAGIASSLQQYVNNPFAGSMPTYYILCDNCGRNDYERLRMTTVQHRDKCKRTLIRRWNRRADNE